MSLFPDGHNICKQGKMLIRQAVKMNHGIAEKNIVCTHCLVSYSVHDLTAAMMMSRLKIKCTISRLLWSFFNQPN